MKLSLLRTPFSLKSFWIGAVGLSAREHWVLHYGRLTNDPSVIETCPIPNRLPMPFTYHRPVRFQDTDAAGVVYFANVLAMCHEAYETSLAAAGINLRLFFSGIDFAVPIVHASADFHAPMLCGDRLELRLFATAVKESEFEVTYGIFLENQSEKAVVTAKTRHVCIDPEQRARLPLPEELMNWLQTCAAPAS